MTDRDQHRVREATLTGDPRAGLPRTEIAASWRRVAATGLDPGSGADIPPVGGAELERRRAASGLADLVPRLAESLAPVVDAGQLVVVADAEGRVLWRLGSSRVRRLADDLGFVGGSAWTEANVGTNAIGTALVLGTPVQVLGAEHFVESHTRWGCAAAPLVDPWTGRTLGVVDVSGPSRGMHPAELALVELAARLTSAELVARHRAALDRLRARAAPLLARLTGDVLATDHAGHLAASIGSRSPDRVALPDGLRAGRVWLPTLGDATVEPLDGGWLLRLEGGGHDGGPGTSVVLDLDGDPRLLVGGPSGSWSRTLSPRHAEILLALVGAGSAGRTAVQLAEDLFDDPGRTVTVRAEVSRLRRLAGSLLLSGPYRIAPGPTTEVRGDRTAALPRSSAPVVRRWRATV
ncbi:GAF domain-containing protein [Nocardioides okcheonensis]|uniref:GAF domain-containing protein n=1 Tax=Nocardioides okcheonensis TaxID=2894081 RepID=UPI001E3163E9|nr:GAF domain-containing protein [Nocardioides okcheonensis]UFN43886.1 GAF domain-containing protein [Nocardioides okcheonensis]